MNEPNDERQHHHPYLQLTESMWGDSDLQDLINRPQFMFDLGCAIDGMRDLRLLNWPSKVFLPALVGLVLSGLRQNFEEQQSILTEEERRRSAKLLEEAFNAFELHETEAPQDSTDEPRVEGDTGSL